MQNKRHVLVTGILVLLVGAAAFVAGRLFSRDVNPVASDGPRDGGPGLAFSSSNIIQAVSFDPGIGGILGDSVDVNSAPKIEILMTAKTTVYRDTTQVSVSAASGNAAIQQTVEESTLDDLNPPTMITVWGRKTGDRIIADVLLFSNSLDIQKP